MLWLVWLSQPSLCFGRRANLSCRRNALPELSPGIVCSPAWQEQKERAIKPNPVILPNWDEAATTQAGAPGNWAKQQVVSHLLCLAGGQDCDYSAVEHIEGGRNCWEFSC